MTSALSARLVLLAALLLLLAGAALGADGFEHPAFASNSRRPTRVLVLQPQSSIIRSRLTDSTALVKESAQLERSCADAVAHALDTLGYDGDSVELTPEKLNADAELRDLVTRFQERVDELVGVALNRPKDVRSGRFTIGEDVLPLAARTKAEGFIVVHAQAVIPSRGQRTLSALFSVIGGAPPLPPTNSTRGIAILIDGRTGDLAWLAGGQVGGAVAKEPDVVGTHLGTALLKSYPKAGEVHAQKKRKTDPKQGEVPSVPRVADTETGDTDAVIAAFEAAAKDAPPSAQRAEAAPTPTEPTAIPAREPAVPIAPPVEDIPARDDFEKAQAILPAKAPVAAGDGPQAAAAAAASPEELTAIRALWSMSEELRPAPTRQVVLQMLEGGPRLAVRNMSEPGIRVSIDLGGWIPLEPAERHEVAVERGSHRILVVDAAGTEITRGSVVIGSGALASAEIWPRP